MLLFRIEDIISNKLDDSGYVGEYRVGCLVANLNYSINGIMTFDYIEDKSGNKMTGRLRSSVILSINEENERIHIETFNRTYTFKKVGDICVEKSNSHNDLTAVLEMSIKDKTGEI